MLTVNANVKPLLQTHVEKVVHDVEAAVSDIRFCNECCIIWREFQPRFLANLPKERLNLALTLFYLTARHTPRCAPFVIVSCPLQKQNFPVMLKRAADNVETRIEIRRRCGEYHAKYRTAFLKILSPGPYVGIFFFSRRYFSLRNVQCGSCVKNIARSGCGMMPITRPLCEVTLAIPSVVPVGFAGRSRCWHISSFT